MTTSVPVPVPPVPYAGTVNPPPVAVTVPDGGPFDAAYKAAGWTPPTPPPPAGLDVKGFNMPVWGATDYSSPTWQAYPAQTAADGSNWVGIYCYVYFVSEADPVLNPNNPQMPTDASIVAAIQAAHAAGQKVCLKLALSPEDGISSGNWMPANVAAFMASYLPLVTHYATMAQANHCEAFLVATELDTFAMADPASMRSMIAAARAVYAGLVSYAATKWFYEQITFWDAVDFIGIEAYFDLVPAAQANTSNTNVAAMVAYLSSGVQSNGLTAIPSMAALAAKNNKQIVFTEVGFMSVIGCAYQPWASSTLLAHAVSNPDQTAAFQALLEATAGLAWFGGMLIWGWDIVGKTEAQAVRDYTPHYKPAEQTLKAAWSTTPPPVLVPAVGVNLHSFDSAADEAVFPAALALFKTMGSTWLRFDVLWSELVGQYAAIYQARLDTIVAGCVANKIRPILTIWNTPPAQGATPQTPPPPAAYAAFCATIAARYKGEGIAIEIWNEPDGAGFWTGTPAQYAAMIEAAWPAIKAADPTCLVIGGALETTDTTWLNDLYAAGWKGSYDAVSVHPYPWPTDSAPSTPNTGIALVPAFRAAMTAQGDTSPLWLTEFGWSTSDVGVTPALQASYLTAALAQIAALPYVLVACIYEGIDEPGETGIQTSFGIVESPSLTPKPAYAAVEAWIAAE